MKYPRIAAILGLFFSLILTGSPAISSAGMVSGDQTTLSGCYLWDFAVAADDSLTALCFGGNVEVARLSPDLDFRWSNVVDTGNQRPINSRMDVDPDGNVLVATTFCTDWETFDPSGWACYESIGHLAILDEVDGSLLEERVFQDDGVPGLAGAFDARRFGDRVAVLTRKCGTVEDDECVDYRSTLHVLDANLDDITVQDLGPVPSPDVELISVHPSGEGFAVNRGTNDIQFETSYRDINGAVLWSRYWPFSAWSRLKTTAERVYVTSADELRAFDVTTGDLDWSFSSDYMFYADDAGVLLNSAGIAYSLSPTGVTNWAYDFDTVIGHYPEQFTRPRCRGGVMAMGSSSEPWAEVLLVNDAGVLVDRQTTVESDAEEIWPIALGTQSDGTVVAAMFVVIMLAEDSDYPSGDALVRRYTMTDAEGADCTASPDDDEEDDDTGDDDGDDDLDDDLGEGEDSASDDDDSDGCGVGG